MRLNSRPHNNSSVSLVAVVFADWFPSAIRASTVCERCDNDQVPGWVGGGRTGRIGGPLARDRCGLARESPEEKVLKTHGLKRAGDIFVLDTEARIKTKVKRNPPAHATVGE